MHSKDFTAHAELRAQRIGQTDPNAWRHLCASRHVKAEPDAEADRAYLRRRARRETWQAIGAALAWVGGSAVVLAFVALWAVTTFAHAATYSHVRVVDGDAYVLDYALSAEDCAAVAQADSDDCIRE